MKDCVFCDIAQGKTNTKLVKETKNLVVFNDINPQAAIHYLIVPKEHISDLGSLDDKIWKEIKDVSVVIARDRSVKGYRLVHNSGEAASISHLQIHFLADITPETA
jgi:histidine triad (HIT) family protein